MRSVAVTMLLGVGCTFGGGGSGGVADSLGGATGGSSTGGSTPVGSSDGGGDTLATGDGGSSMGLVDTTAGTPGDATTFDATTSDTTTSSTTSGSSGAGSGSSSGEASSSSGDPLQCQTNPWFDPDWAARRRLDIDNTGFSDGLTGFPVLLRLNDERIDYDLTQRDGADLRVVADDHTTVLAHEVEAWNPGGDSVVWVRVPSLPDEDSVPAPLYIYYGNAAAADLDAGADVWDSDFVSVHHMATFDDSTDGGHHGFSVSLPTTPDGIIGPTAQFDGVDDYIELPAEGDFDFSNQLTVSALVSVDSFTAEWQAIVTKGDDAWRMHRQGFTDFVGFGTDLAGANINQSGSTSIANGDWYHVTVIMDGFTKRIFVDASLDAQVAGGFVDQSGDPVMFGENSQVTGRLFHGRIDEVRISDTNRSDTWIDAEARTMLTDDMVTFAAEETCVP